MTYTIEYDHTSGHRKKDTDDIELFSKWLDEAIEDSHVLTHTIKVNTK